METPYRKEQILNIVDRCFHMYASDYRNDARIFATEMLEEIPETIKSDNTQTLSNSLHQIEKLEADKAELLEALEGLYNSIERLPDIEYVIYGKQIESLIQKHKQ